MIRVFGFLFSTRMMALLFLLFALSMAIATFLEDSYSSDIAKSLIYEAKWFELIIVLLVICFLGNIKRYRLWQKRKIPLLTFHLAFVIILLGGAFSRYAGFEGVMLIRQGKQSNEIISEKPYIKLEITHKGKTLAYYDSVRLHPLNQYYQKRFLFEDQIFKIKLKEYIPHAKQTFIADNKGLTSIKIVSTSAKGRLEHYIPLGGEKKINGLSISFNHKKSEDPLAISIIKKEEKLYIQSPLKGDYMVMATQKKGSLTKEIPSPLYLRALYDINHQKIVFPEPPQKGFITYVRSFEDDSLSDLIKLELSTKDKKKEISFFGKKYAPDMGLKTHLDGKQIHIGYGSIIYKTPFLLELTKFHMESYPGSHKPSSFTSDILLKEGDKKIKHSIFMNNTLTHRGYRFFQSGYDKDEKGTQLSVNYDRKGTVITYIGYFLLTLSMFLSLFWKGTRFDKLRTLLKKQNSLYKNLFFIGFFLLFSAIKAQAHKEFSLKETSLEAFTKTIAISKDHAKNFSSLIVQDGQGRMKPIDTMALELLRKLHHKDTIGGLNACQWMISIHHDPFSWSQVPFIKVNKKVGDLFLKQTKANAKGYTSLIHLYLFDTKTNEIHFILEEAYKEAFSKKPSKRTLYDKAIIDLNEKISILSEIFQGSYLRIFPLKNNPEKKWVSWNIPYAYEEAKDNFFLKLRKDYFQYLYHATKDQNWDSANKVVEKISLYQKKYGKEIIPSKTKIHAELLYNKLTIFYFSMISFLIIGVLFFILSFLRIFSNLNYSVLASLLKGFFLFTLLYQGFGLALRGYVSLHAPWSNSYESAVFISWIIALVGFFFSKKSLFPSTIACLNSAILLGVAHSSLMSPEITSLVPVLKSYWLMIHVTVISSSYGFFSIGAFLGLTVLILYLLKLFSKNKKLDHSINELSLINEMSLTIGIFLLTIGTFLGGIWANESWGSYWSWDPKETWALISIIVYAFVLHMRLIPKLKGDFAFNTASLLALSSIIMTYFGVNYYLSGLHSYAKGDPIPIPSWIYYTLIGVSLLIISSYYSFKKVK